MSYFDLSTDGKIPRDGLRKHVQTQIPTEGGSTSGLIRFRWTSSQDSWFIPSLSYVMYEFEVQKTGGNVVAADEFVTCAFPGAAASSGGPTTVQLGSTNVATITSPGVTAAMYARQYGNMETRETIMEPFNKGFFSADLKTFNVCYQPPCGFFNTDVAIPSGSYVLGINLSTNYINDMMASRATADKGALIPGLSIVLKKATFMATHVQPSGTPSIPKTVTIPLIDISTNNQSVTAAGNHTLSFSVPASTKRCLLATQLLSQSASTYKGITNFSGAAFQTLSGQFKGQSVPQVPYSSESSETVRKYLDFYNEQLSSGRSGYDTITEYKAEPIVLLPFASDPQNMDTNLILRTQMDGSTQQSLVHVGTVHDSVLVLNFNNDGSVMESCTYAVLS